MTKLLNNAYEFLLTECHKHGIIAKNSSLSAEQLKILLKEIQQYIHVKGKQDV